MARQAEQDCYIANVALQAARELENGNYEAVQNLHDRLIEQGYPAELVDKTFDANGASIALIPQAVAAHGCSMLFAIKG